MRKITLALLLLAALPLCAEDKVFDWVHASDEVAQLDPSDFHAGRTYRPGQYGGKLHVDIRAEQPVTVMMTWSKDWERAMANGENPESLSYRCVRTHVVDTTFTCELTPGDPMILIVKDERRPTMSKPESAVVRSIDAALGVPPAPRRMISPSTLKITYYRWDCVRNCVQPEFRWVQLVKEKYEVTTVPKTYTLLTPETDGQQVSVVIKAPVPMTIAVLPSRLADQAYSSPENLESALSQSSCKQRGVQSMTFQCTFSRADGPQSLLVMPQTPQVPKHKKAELELQAVKCVDHCDLLNQ